MKRFVLDQPVTDSSLTGGDEVNTVYGDLVTFIMVLFILLFVLVYNERQTETFISEMQIKFGSKKVEQEQVVTTEDLFVSKVRNFIEKEKLEDHAKILVDEQKIKLILNPPVLFDSGKAELKPFGQRILSEFGKILSETENPIFIEGHTDNVPIKNDEFDSNWDLSFHRAYAVIRHYIQTYKFSPKQLSGTGYGEFQPLFANDTDEHRARNRRIEINIIRITQAVQK